VRLGLFLPVSGRAATRETLVEAARQAERWGFDSVWAADRIVIPWQIETGYAYNESGSFFVPPDRPFLEALTTMAFLAGCTERVRLGVSVLVLPYRNPLYWAKVVTTIDHLSEGRFVLGVGVGWMREEFEALGADFERRGAVADEHLEIWRVLTTEEHASHEGRLHRFDDIGFLPKHYRAPIPIWVGGEGRAARQRAGRDGDAWFPYFVRITPDELRARFEEVREFAAQAGRTPEAVGLNCCLPIEVTKEPAPQTPDRLRGTPEQLVEALRRFGEIGVDTVALQFMAPRYPARLEQIERFATEALPHLADGPVASAGY
jgi:probable F420-dependent oxidoreductase